MNEKDLGYRRLFYNSASYKTRHEDATTTTQWGRSSKRHSFTRWWYHFRIIPQSSFAYHIFVMLPEAPSVDTVDKYAQHSGLLKMHCTLPLVSSSSRSVFCVAEHMHWELETHSSQAGRQAAHLNNHHHRWWFVLHLDNDTFRNKNRRTATHSLIKTFHYTSVGASNISLFSATYQHTGPYIIARVYVVATQQQPCQPIDSSHGHVECKAQLTSQPTEQFNSLLSGITILDVLNFWSLFCKMFIKLASKNATLFSLISWLRC